jgi:hypothetical protein
MNSLTSAPVADVLTRMFHEAQATDGPLEERCAEVASDDKALAEFLALEAKDYKGTYEPRQRNVCSHGVIRRLACQHSSTPSR